MKACKTSSFSRLKTQTLCFLASNFCWCIFENCIQRLTYEYNYKLAVATAVGPNCLNYMSTLPMVKRVALNSSFSP